MIHYRKPRTLRKYVYDILHNLDYESQIGRYIEGFLIFLIIANVFSVVISSINDWYVTYQSYFDGFENFSIIVFTMEFLLRLWSAAEHNPKLSAWQNRWTWLNDPHAMVDIIAILPAYINFFVHIDLRYLIVLRLFRLFKLTRYFVALGILLKVIAREKESFKAVLLILMILVIVAASGIYLVEHEAQPDKFDSIPKAMWWAVVTLTTVGYGDVTPITTAGKILGAVITILGIGIAALPAGILASGIANELALRREAMEEEFRDKLVENEIDLKKEKHIVENLRKNLGLTSDQAEHVVNKLLKEQEVQEEHKHLNYCPNCGFALHQHRHDLDD